MPSAPNQKQQKSRPLSNLLLIAAIDDLLGLQKKAEKVLEDKVAGKGEKMFNEQEVNVLKHYEQGLQKTLDIIAPAGMEIKKNELIINETYVRTLYVMNWPNYIYPNWLSTLINFDAEMEISQFIYPSSNKIIMKMLRKKVTEMRASIRMLEQRGIVRDPTLEAALQDAEELRDLLARGREKLYQFGMYISLYSSDEEKLKKLQIDVESIMSGKLVLTKPSVFQMEHGWISTLPFALDELEINRNMNTSPLATSFPFSSSDLTDDHGILYGINRHNDSLVIFDRFDLANANATVFATSGAGKSYTVKLELLRALMFNTEVFVIDPENEYVELAQAVGGTFLPMSLQSSFRINPFDLPREVRGDEALVGEALRAAVINLHGLFKLMLGTLTPAEDGILDKAILDTYALKNITLKTENPHELEPPTMHELVDVLMTTNGGEHMAQTLKKYTEGSYAGIFNQQTNVELDNQMVVFQIRDLEDQLRPIAMYIILNYLWNQIRSDLKRRFLVIDEAWNLLQYEDSARFLYGLIKRARKYFLGVTTITQDVEDFVNSPYGKPIITNSSLQILLKQSATAVDNLQKLFYLTDGEKYLLLNSDVGQGLFFAGNKHVAIQIVASPQEDKLITTKPDEVLKKKKLHEEEMKAKKREQEIQAAAEEVSDAHKKEQEAKAAEAEKEPEAEEPEPKEDVAHELAPADEKRKAEREKDEENKKPDKPTMMDKIESMAHSKDYEKTVETKLHGYDEPSEEEQALADEGEDEDEEGFSAEERAAESDAEKHEHELDAADTKEQQEAEKEQDGDNPYMNMKG